MAFFLILAFLLIPIAEIAIFIQVGGLIGLWPTLFGIVFTAILGSFIVRRQGFEALRRARASMDRNELPVAEIFDGLCLFLAGALLLTPGFLTDTLGFLLLVPPLRAVVRRSLWAELLRRGTFVHVGRGGAGPTRPGPAGRRPGGGGPAGRGDVIEGEFTEVTDEDENDRGEGGASDRDHPWKPRG